MNFHQNGESKGRGVCPRLRLIRYEFEVSKKRDLWWTSLDIRREYLDLDAAVRRRRDRAQGFAIDDAPLFHPGRVIVSHEVMVRLGKRGVLFFLNLFVRGGHSDRGSAG